MANGFVKLEQFFTRSKRLSRSKQKSTQEQQKTGVAATRRPSSPVFPSPSYLRPTSIAMLPRDPQVHGAETDKGRSRSLPSFEEALHKHKHKRSSIASSITIVNVNSRARRSKALASSSLRNSKLSQDEPCPSSIQFKEDSLFKDKKTTRSSDPFHRKEQSQELSPLRTRETKHSSGKGLLDWAPKHISFLFDPLEFTASSDDDRHDRRDRQWGSRSTNSTGSTLLPSPDFAPSMLLPTDCEPVADQSQPTVALPPLGPCNSVQKLTMNLRSRQSFLSGGESVIRSQPGPESNSYYVKPEIYRSMSVGSPVLPRQNPSSTPNRFSTNTTGNFIGRPTVRETWGKRLDDPRSTSSPSRKNDAVSSKLQRSASTSTLSQMTPQVPQDRVLKEPTFDDFYSLSDEDIAESRPATPIHDSRLPPTPPPKDNKYFRNSYGGRYLSQHPTSRHFTSGPARDITPPHDPTDYHRLALNYSPTSRRDADGALRAAELARKYDFAVLYVLSLWPVDSQNCLVVTANTRGSLPQAPNATVTDKASGINGRLLAAYGLNEVPSPFEIVTETHLSALNCDYWNEYRNVDARPADISRGWIRPFYSDYVPVSAPLMDASNPAGQPLKNRGIVFAAYSKQTLNPIIPLNASPEQNSLLRQLSSDVEALVDALVSEPHMGYRDLRKQNPNKRQSHVSS